MYHQFLEGGLLACTMISASVAWAGQAPGAASSPDIPISHRDRVYAAEQFSNTVSVTDPVDNRLLGVIRLGDPQPGNFSPLYKGQVLVHGMGFSPDRKTLAVVSIGSNSVTFIDTATNAVKHTTYVGRSPHEAFFTPDGKEVWVTVRGEDYISVIDGTTFEEKTRIKVPAGPGMQIFSPDGKYGYVCSSFNPETVVIVGRRPQPSSARVKQESPFCPNIAATPDGEQVWFTLKDIGKTQVFDARPPFAPPQDARDRPDHQPRQLRPQRQRTRSPMSRSAALNEVKVFRTDDFSQVATIPVGNLPHGIWPSGDGTRIYVGLENADALAAIDTATNKVVATIPIGQAPQAIAYVPNAVPECRTIVRICSRSALPAQVAHLALGARAEVKRREAADQRIAVRPGPDPDPAGLGDRALNRRSRYVLALADEIDGTGSRRAACGLHDQPGRFGHRQRDRSDPADRAEFRSERPAISGNRTRRAHEVRESRAGPEPMSDMLRQIEPVIPALRRYARALVRNRATADDLVQDCLERAVSHWGQRRDGDPRPWLFTILHNLAVNQFRRSASRGKHIAIDDANEAEFGQDAVQEQKLMYRDVLDKLARLPEDQRAVLLLVAVEDLSYADAARVLDIPIGTVMSRLSRARERLQQEMEGTADGTPENVVQLRSMK